MNQFKRIGTYCEKCGEALCRCAEHAAELEKIKNLETPASSFENWVKHSLDGEAKPSSQQKQSIYEVNPNFANAFKEPYGWVIEQNMNVKYQSKDGSYKWTGWQGWVGNWKNKVYKTKKMVLHAIEQMRKSNGSNAKISYRMLPVYSGEPEVLDNVMDLPLKIE